MYLTSIAVRYSLEVLDCIVSVIWHSLRATNNHMAGTLMARSKWKGPGERLRDAAQLGHEEKGKKGAL
jgi:hypothetical protein